MNRPVYEEKFKALEGRVKLLEGISFNLTNTVEKLNKAVMRLAKGPKKKTTKKAS